MEPAPDLGCNEDIHPEEENNSVLSEKCWQETYRGDSRKWLMRDGSRKKYDAPIISTMKATYPYPFQDERKYLGERRAVLLKQLYDEAAEEIIQERNQPPEVEKYCTEYDGNYNTWETPEEEVEAKQELYEKYPLYSSPAMSFWNFKIEKNLRRKEFLPGLTASADLKNPFKRNAAFTKPITEVLDDCHLL